MTLITMDGEYQTRDGRPVRVLCVDRIGTQYPVIALVPAVTGPERELFEHYTKEGHTERIGASHLDLIPVPKKHKRTVWMVHYPNGACSAWSYNPSHFVNALAITGPHEIEFTEGEGLKGDDDAQTKD